MKLNEVQDIAFMTTEQLSAGSRHNIGMTVFFLRDEKRNALKHLTEALKLEPDNERFQKSFYMMWNAMGSDEDIIELARSLKRENFRVMRLQLGLASAYERKGDVDAAISGWTAILERDPRNGRRYRGWRKHMNARATWTQLSRVWTAILERDPSNWSGGTMAWQKHMNARATWMQLSRV